MTQKCPPDFGKSGAMKVEKGKAQKDSEKKFDKHGNGTEDEGKKIKRTDGC